MNTAVLSDSIPDTRRWQWLPPVGSAGYYLLLGAIGMLVLGPLGGITAAFMNFSIGFFVGGQVLAGILGSVVTYGYGSEGRHGANYIQTTAASVAEPVSPMMTAANRTNEASSIHSAAVPTRHGPGR